MVTAPAPAASAEFLDRIAFFEQVARDWIASGVATVACGAWGEVGVIAELIPRGNAELLPAAYPDCFAGVRELRLSDATHHIHFDLGRVHRARYAVAPSVCFRGRPSFEVRLLLTGAGGTKTQRASITIMLTSPYADGALDEAQLTAFFERARLHAGARPDLVDVHIDPAIESSPDSDAILRAVRRATGERAEDASSIEKALARLRPRSSAEQNVEANDGEPVILPLLREALRFQESSLVIFRDRTLVELQTERLAGVFRYEEAGHVSWQVGEFEDHHCHLALGEVASVLFSAEPVSCQGGRLNYTVWFRTAGPCGNPYRPDGYFSIVLNRPYDAGRPRLRIIGQLFDLYTRHAHEPWVSADATFVRAIEEATRGLRGDHARAREGASHAGTNVLSGDANP